MNIENTWLISEIIARTLPAPSLMYSHTKAAADKL